MTDYHLVSDSTKTKKSLWGSTKDMANWVLSAVKTDEQAAPQLPAKYITAKGPSYDVVMNKLRCKWALQMGAPITSLNFYKIDETRYMLRDESAPENYKHYPVVFRLGGNMLKTVIHGYASIEEEGEIPLQHPLS
jgi:hypothetical protein